MIRSVFTDVRLRATAGVAGAGLVAALLAGCGGTASAAAASSAPASTTAASPSASADASASESRGFRPRPSGSGTAFGNQAALTAAAQALNMQPADLRTQLAQGKNLKDIAAAQKVDYTTVATAVTNAIKPQLDQAVQNGRITQQQEQQFLDRIQAGDLGGFAGPRGSGRARPAPSASSSS